MAEKQRTIKKEVSVEGIGLHTGKKALLTLRPASENTGIVFKRIDLKDSPEIKACAENVMVDKDVPRCTTIGKKNALVHTVEHFMAVLCGLGIDNLFVDIDNEEIPGLDGSGIEFLKVIKNAGIVEQDAERQYYSIPKSFTVHRGGASISITPAEDFMISYVLDYDHPVLRSQVFNVKVSPEVFEQELASCRTFCLEAEAKKLQESGLGQGATYDNTLVVGDKGVVGNKVRFPDEFARHKVLDFIGDLYLLGMPIKGHVFAFKSGHNLNVELLKKIAKQQDIEKKRGVVSEYKIGDKTEIGIQEIMKILPHRYPFLLVDRIVNLEKGKRAVGIKNVTINDNFFTGHFPAKPIMPGVLQVEAMAQVGGILVSANEMHKGKIALFMSTDNVKFRKVVSPGDQLVMEVELVRERSRMASLHGVGKVDGEVVVEADVAFSFIDVSFLN